MAGPAGLQNTSLYFALRAVLRTFKIAPGDFVEPLGSHPAPASKYFFVPRLAFSQYGWAGWIRTNECQDQNLVPYRLATAH